MYMRDLFLIMGFSTTLSETNGFSPPENGWLEYEFFFPFGAFGPLFKGELLVSGSVLNWFSRQISGAQYP